MRKTYLAIAAFCGLIVVFGAVYVMQRHFWAQDRLDSLGALYFLEVERSDAESFAWDVGQITGYGSGYIMGTSIIFTVRSDKPCNEDTELEEYLISYKGTHQFVCYPTSFREHQRVLVK